MPGAACYTLVMEVTMRHVVVMVDRSDDRAQLRRVFASIDKHGAIDWPTAQLLLGGHQPFETPARHSGPVGPMRVVEIRPSDDPGAPDASTGRKRTPDA